jgi:peptidyl-prolyl cis-trans isomerase D
MYAGQSIVLHFFIQGKYMAKKPQSIGKLGRVERENRYNKIVMTTAFAIIGLIIIIVVSGAISSTLIIPNTSVATVNGEEIITSEYQVRVRLERQRLVNLHTNYLQLLQLYGESDEAFTSQAISSMRQIQFQLDPYTMGKSILDAFIDEKIIVQEAIAQGIEVSPEEIDELFQIQFGYFPNGNPTPTLAITTAPTSTLTADQLSMIPPTATLEVIDEVNIEPTDEIADDGSVIETATPLFEFPTPTATVFTETMYETAVVDYLKLQKEEIKLSRENLESFLLAQLYREKLIALYTADLSRTQEMVWARHILVEDEIIMAELVEKLQDGEDWFSLALEYSNDESNSQFGGDLGWFNDTTMIPEFSRVAFNTEIGETSNPVKTDFGFHLIQVLGHEDRPLSADAYASYQSQEFSLWLSEKRAQLEQENKIVINEKWEQRIPTDPVVTFTIE